MSSTTAIKNTNGAKKQKRITIDWRTPENWMEERSRERMRAAWDARAKGEATPLDPPGLLKAILGLALAIDGMEAFIRDRPLPERKGHTDDCSCVSCMMGSDPEGMLWMIQHLHGILENDVITREPCLKDDFDFPDINTLLRMFGGEEKATA